MLDQPHCPLEDRRGAPVVGLEVHARQVGQGLVCEAEEPPDVREAPAVDGLIVVADQEDPIRWRCQQEREPQLRAIQVLRLVHEEVSAPLAPRRKHRGVPLQEAECPRNQVVEVEAAAAPDLRLVRRKRTGNGPGLGIRLDRQRVDVQVELEARQDRVEAPPLGDRHFGAHGAKDLVAIKERLHRHAGASQHLQPQRMEGTDPDTCRETLAQRLQRRRYALPKLLRGPLVEGDGADGLRRRAPVDEPCDTRHEGRRLPGAGRRDAQHRAGWRHGGTALVRREPRQSRHNR